MITKQSQAIAMINEMLAIAAQLAGFYQASVRIATQYENQGIADLIAAMPTVPFNANGTLSDTPDAETNPDHPIDIRLVPGLNRAVTPNELAAVHTLILDCIAFVRNQPVTQKDRAIVVDKVIGG
jgi:hypothetical protein